MSVKVNLEKHCNEANSWLLEIAENIDHPGRTDWAYGCLKAVLHTIRDRTTLEEVFHFSAQLPVLIRGIYFEGYKPTGKPEKMNANEFIQNIKKGIGPGGFGYPEEAFRVVLELLYDKTSPGEMDDIRGSMPKGIQKVWDKYRPLELDEEPEM